MKNITEAITRTAELLDQQQGEITIEHHEPGLDVEIKWDGAKCIVKPAIGRHRLEFRTPDNQWGWEIGIGYPEMPGAILAGLQIIKRIPVPPTSESPDDDLRDAAQAVVDAWEGGDLAAAVRRLAEVLKPDA